MLEQFNEKFCNLTISLLPQIVMTTIRVFSKKIIIIITTKECKPRNVEHVKVRRSKK